MRKTPALTAVVVLSLALGIGANTAIFTLIESSLLRPIAVRHPESLRLLTWREQWGGWVPPNLGFRSPTFGTLYEQRETADGGLLHTDFPPALYRQFARNHDVFESLFAFKELGRVTAVADGNAEPVNCFLVSGGFYRGLEVTPALGRAIGPENDARSGANQVAVISYAYWTRRFGRSPSVIGKTIELNDVPFTIVGVNPEYFTGIEPGGHFEVWAPLNLPPAVYGLLQHGAEFNALTEHFFLDNEKAWSVPMMGRLKPGISDARAQSMLDAMFQQHVDSNPGPLAGMLKEPAKRPRFLLQSAARGVDYLTERYDRMLLAVLALAGLVLLIACANVANLLLARSAVRQRDISLRLALGASRWRIARQLLTEGLLLAAVAGIAGVITGYFARNAIPGLLSTPWRPNLFDAAFDPRVLLVALGMTAATGVLFSLAPMWQSRRVEMNEALKDGSRGTVGLSRLRLGRLLVAAQVALSLILLVGAGLCMRTFTNLRHLPLGFQPEGVLLFSLDPPRQSYPAGRMPALIDSFERRLEAIPGVQSASFSGNRAGSVVAPEGRKLDRSFDSYARETDVGSGFFKTLGIRLVYGRALDGRDGAAGLRNVVVNEAFARHFYPGESPMEKIFRDSKERPYQIVGVCADWRADQFRDPVRPAFYGSLLQEPQAGTVDFEVKFAGRESEAVRQIREAARSVDPKLVLFDIRTETEQVQNALSQERLLASLGATFGALALLLASIGVYGVMAYAVARRTGEIGIRMALGALPANVAWNVLRETLLLACLGVALGIPAVLATAPLLDRFLAPGWEKTFAYGVKANDPMLIVVAAVAMAAVAFCAGYIPARRAAAIDPMTALRHD